MGWWLVVEAFDVRHGIVVLADVAIAAWCVRTVLRGD
jgi:hypothetical protein